MPISTAQLTSLINTHGAALRLWIHSRCVASEDVVQETFCRLAVEDPPPENPGAWLYRVCRNLAEKQRLSDLRRRRREIDRPAQAEYRVDPSEELELAETLAAVEQLDENLREVLVGRIWGQLTLDEVAGLCGISAATAWRRYRAALDELRTRLALPLERRP